MQSNWPLLTVSKGFFESAMTAKGVSVVLHVVRESKWYKMLAHESV